MTIKKDVDVVLVFEKNEKFLMFNHKKIGDWVFPIGTVDEGETLEKALVREAKEELGILVTGWEFLFKKEIMITDNFMSESNYFLIKSYNGVLTNIEPHKHLDMGFNSLNYSSIEQVVEFRKEVENC